MLPECVLDTSTDGFEAFPPLKLPLVGSTWCPQKMVFSVRPAAYISLQACVKRGFCGQVRPDVHRGWGRYCVLLGIRQPTARKGCGGLHPGLPTKIYFQLHPERQFDRPGDRK
eukprot:gene14976-biopygen23152